MYTGCNLKFLPHKYLLVKTKHSWLCSPFPLDRVVSNVNDPLDDAPSVHWAKQSIQRKLLECLPPVYLDMLHTFAFVGNEKKFDLSYPECHSF